MVYYGQVINQHIEEVHHVQYQCNVRNTMGLGFPEVLIVLFLLAGALFWVWMLVDCAIHERGATKRQIVWLVVIALTYVPGALLYVAVRRAQRKALQR